MSLARAFTTRRVRMSNELAEASKTPNRSNTTGKAKTIGVQKISAPVQLVHTTNMLAYNAPDLPRGKRSNSIHKSDDDAASQSTIDSTPPTSPDIEPGERCSSPEANRLSSYFMAPGKQTFTPASKPVSPDAAPAIPSRAPSHTKKASYDTISRQRSGRMSKESQQSSSSKHSYTFSRSSSVSTNASSHASAPDMYKYSAPPVPPPSTIPTLSIPEKATRKEHHPFGQELAQVTELVEEFGTSASDEFKVMSEDDLYLATHGLVKWSASDYLGEVNGLYDNFFTEQHSRRLSAAPLWI